MSSNLKKPLLIFDLGNILFELEGVEAFWPEDSNQPELCQARWNSSEVAYLLETGKIDNFADFYRDICAELNIKLKPDEFEKAFLGIIGEPFSGTEKMLEELAGNYRLMILSNTNEPHWLYCLDKLPLTKYVETSFLSHEIGAMKPDDMIYEQVLEKLKVDPENIYYFDDKEENVVVARKHGMKAYRSWGGETLRQQLRKLGFLH
ncbi:MAG: HAD-IA family hydrolase [Clostridiaceae bacterium]|jgi:putative hydrolase of the HAD superfamily|nr:HAD-IA family hydrolase [Clostridiaceae bacterium]